MASPFHGIFSALGSSGDAEEFPSKTGKRPTARGAADDSHEPGRLALDIYEQDDYYIVRAPIAGVRLSDLDIEVSGNVLTIRGNRRAPESVERSQFYLQECYWGPFSRSITLPIDIDPRKVRATFNRDCILKILIPREERVKIVRIAEG